MTWPSESREDLAVCRRAKVVLSFLSYFKSGPENRTQDIPLCNQALYRPSSSFAIEKGLTFAQSLQSYVIEPNNRGDETGGGGWAGVVMPAG